MEQLVGTRTTVRHTSGCHLCKKQPCQEACPYKLLQDSSCPPGTCHLGLKAVLSVKSIRAPVNWPHPLAGPYGLHWSRGIWLFEAKGILVHKHAGAVVGCLGKMLIKALKDANLCSETASRILIGGFSDHLSEYRDLDLRSWGWELRPKLWSPLQRDS